MNIPDDLGQERPPGALATPAFFELASAVTANDADGEGDDFDIETHVQSLGGDMESASYMATQRTLRTPLRGDPMVEIMASGLWIDGYVAALRMMKEREK